MLRLVGRRGLAAIAESSSASSSSSSSTSSRVLRNSGYDGGGFSADCNPGALGLRLMGSAGQQQARPLMGGVTGLLPGAAKEVVQVLKGVFHSGRIGSGPGAGAFQLSQVRGFIQLRTNLEVADNSGARRVQCIKVMKGSNAAKIGDIIMASVKDAQPRGKVKKGEVVTCVVVRAATQKLRRDGSEIKFDRNAVVLINKQGEPIGTRIFGPVPHELRRRKFVKILTLAEYVA